LITKNPGRKEGETQCLKGDNKGNKRREENTTQQVLGGDEGGAGRAMVRGRRQRAPHRDLCPPIHEGG